MLRIGQSRTDTPADSALLRQRFAQQYALVLDDVIDPPFLAMLSGVADRATFVPEHIAKVGDRTIETPPIASHLITLALRRTGFLGWLGDVTQVGDIDDIEGKVVETGRSDVGQLGWHDDTNHSNRRLAVTISLSGNDYSGGVFEMRRKGQADLLFSHHHDRFGSVLVFRVSRKMEHRLTPVTRGGPRRVFAGWFLGTP